MIDYKAAYNLVMELQEALEREHDDKELNRPDYRKIQALAATYTLQEYLANTIAELEASGTLESEEEGSDMFDESPEEEAFWEDLMMQLAQMEGAALRVENEQLKNDPSFIVPEGLTQRSLETIQKVFERKKQP